jgi:hypothetical protein
MILVAPCLLCILTVSGFVGIGQTLAHFAAQAVRMNNPESEVAQRLDPVSEACIRCHNEISVSGMDVTDNLIPSHTGPNGRGTSHPVGVIYELSQSKSPDKFLPLSMLNPDIELADGRIGCRSCHAIKIFTDTDSLLTSSNTFPSDTTECLASDHLTITGSVTNLCLSCHKE